MFNKILIIFTVLFIFSCSEENINVNISEKVKSGSEITILALGDSITYGYKVDKKESYPSQLEVKLQENGYNYKVQNFGISGNNSKQLLDRIDDILENNDGDIAILTIGGNDGLRHNSISQMKENILKIISKLEEKNVHIVFAGMELPMLFGWDYSSEFEDAYAEIAEEKNIDFYPYFLEGIGLSVENNQSDNIHPTAKGYTIISNNIYTFLEYKNLLYKNN